MLCFTHLIFVKPGEEQTFERYEAVVLPLLAKYNGRLLLRWRNVPGAAIVGDCYEVHVVAFGTDEDFQRFSADEERHQALPLKQAAVERVISFSAER